MKLFFVIFAVGACCLTAVQWEYEKVFDETEMYSHGSKIALDGNDAPYILYSAGESEDNAYILRLVEPEGENRNILDIDTVPIYKLSFSFDINPDNDVVIVYTDTVIPGISDIYLATYHEGAFDYVNLTDNWVLKLRPIVQVGSDGIVRLVYLEFNGNVADLRYGWYDGETFESESIRDSTDSYGNGFDFCLDAANRPHVFFIGDDYNLRHATRAGADNWTSSTLGMKGYHPSVAMDKKGNFHIGCEDPPDIGYLTDASESWTAETVAVSEGDVDWILPTIAVDPQDNPHMIWYTWMAPYHKPADIDIWFSSRTDGSWSELEALPPDQSKTLGDFKIDSEGYGHACYSIYKDLYYAKTAELLAGGVVDDEPGIAPVSMVVSGSRLRFNLPQPGNIVINLYDASGRMVNELASGYYPAGQNEINISTSALPAGVYFARLEWGGSSAKVRMVLIK